LIELTALQREVPLSEDQRLGKIGKTLVKGAELVTKGLGYGAEKASQLIEYVGEKEKQKAIARGGATVRSEIESGSENNFKGNKICHKFNGPSQRICCKSRWKTDERPRRSFGQ
jgi:hypothetical protein